MSPSASYFVKDLPYPITAFLAANETLTITIDTRLLLAAIAVENGTGQPLGFVTDPPRAPVQGTPTIQAGSGVRQFNAPVYRIVLTAAAAGPVRVFLSDEDIPDFSGELVSAAGSGGIPLLHARVEFDSTGGGANGIGTTTGTLISVPTRKWCWLLGYRLNVSSGMEAATAAISTVRLEVVLQPTGLAPIFGGLYFSHAGESESKHDQAMGTGWITFPEPGFPTGSGPTGGTNVEVAATGSLQGGANPKRWRYQTTAEAIYRLLDI